MLLYSWHACRVVWLVTTHVLRIVFRGGGGSLYHYIRRVGPGHEGSGAQATTFFFFIFLFAFLGAPSPPLLVCITSLLSREGRIQRSLSLSLDIGEDRMSRFEYASLDRPPPVFVMGENIPANFFLDGNCADTGGNLVFFSPT